MIRNNNILTIPNLISASRIVVSPFMFMLWEQRLMLVILVIIIGLTDILDGFAARKLKQQTIFGARLDSIGDFVFFISSIVFALFHETNTVVGFKYLIISIIILKLFAGTVGLIKYKRLVFLHTIGNKITVTVVMTGFCVFLLYRDPLVIEIGLYIAILAVLEELIIMLSGRYEPDIKGIWRRN
ncbi:MAG: CDP-alcohol phosphatidyltransferase family protein [Tannerella sp.]|jgi:CDP-diacylglycerol--glycerol-3-phosphate 3-phosphatidyltransferase|nr:CDP-alcohol phosphatidyltransferase family protein [Tannerella sp.]